MKPSERIKKLDTTVHFGSKELTLTDLHNELLTYRQTIDSIINYLDEQFTIQVDIANQMSRGNHD